MDNTTRARKLAKWLRRQDWYNAYFDDLVQSFCDGHEGEFTIEQAFNWKSTPEGITFWTRANADLKQFINTLD